MKKTHLKKKHSVPKMDITLNEIELFKSRVNPEDPDDVVPEDYEPENVTAPQVHTHTVWGSCAHTIFKIQRYEIEENNYVVSFVFC